MSEPDTPTSTPSPEAVGLLVVLQTRCGCEKAMLIGAKQPPKTITVDLAPVPPQLGGAPDQKKEQRRFYLVAKGTVKHPQTGEPTDALLYIEGPNPDRPRILVPGQIPVDKRILGAGR